MLTDPKRLRAVQMLVLANACWALSFPTMKAMAYLQQPLLPHSSSWFIASMTITIRFGLAALVMLAVSTKSLHQLTRLELWEGLGLGVFASAGLIFQMDGLAYTSASTSAFLTQFYCLLIPLITAARERSWPSGRVVLSCLMVIAGVGVLSDTVPLAVDDLPAQRWDQLRWPKLQMGRGEIETLIGSTIFTAQILWLQRPKFAHNNVNHFTLVMFAVIALTSLPVAWATGEKTDSWLAAWNSAPALAFMGILTAFCTLGAYLLMNYWQPFLTATQAGLLYCLEPVFASLFALFLPGWFSAFAGIQYINERIGLSLLIGGGLITVANVLMQCQPTPKKVAAQPEACG